MDASYINDLVAQVLAWRHCHRPAPRVAAQALPRVRPAAAVAFWCRPKLAVASLALSTCAALAAAGVPHTPDAAAAPKLADTHASPVVLMSTPASSSSLSAPLDSTSMASPNAVSAQARPNIRPVLSDEERQAALLEGKRLRSIELAAVATPASSVHAVEPVSAKFTSSSTVSADGVAVYALMTDITRTRVASELRQQLMSSSATVGDLPGAPRAELMQVATGWRAVVWPFATESAADKARRMLAGRGIRTELLKF